MATSRGRSIGRVGVTFVGLGGLLWWAAGSPNSALLGLLRTPPGAFDALLIRVCGALAWLCLGWFGLAVALQLLQLGSGALAAFSRRAARHVVPRFMLGGARWLVGVTLLAGPLTPGVASAAQVNSGSPAATPPAMLNLDRPVIPNLDRPVAPPFGSVTAAPPAKSGAAPSTSPPTPPPQAPPPQAPRSQTPRSQPPAAPTQTAQPARAPAAPRSPDLASSAPILTGSPHRQTADDTADSVYVVRRGDNLWDIAARHLGPQASLADVARAWPRWYAANRAAIGVYPQLIHPGLVLHVPRD